MAGDKGLHRGLISKGITWVDIEYDEDLRRVLLGIPSLSDLKNGKWYATGYRVTEKPSTKRERIRSDLWDLLSIDRDGETASGGGWQFVGLEFHETTETNSPPAKRGRPKGMGSIDDSEALKEMNELISTKQAKSTHAAAAIVFARRQGSLEGQSEDAIRKRLQKKYKSEFASN